MWVWGYCLVKIHVTHALVYLRSEPVFPDLAAVFVSSSASTSWCSFNTGPGPSSLNPLRRRYRLTSPVPRLRWYNVCAFWWQPVITSSHHWLHFAYFPPLADSNLFFDAQSFHHSSSPWSFFSCLSVRCVNFFTFLIFFLILDMSVLHATLCYDTVYYTGLWLKAGQGYSR